MNLQELFKVQEIIENNIRKISNMEEDQLGKENIFDLRFLALQVKTSEIANLTKCYKYSKVRENVDRDKLMIRYMDAMKFLLSIGNVHEFNIIDRYAIDKVDREESIIKLLSYIFDDIVGLKYEILQNNYIGALTSYTRLFARYVNLAENLGICFSEVYSYYMEHYVKSSDKISG